MLIRLTATCLKAAADHAAVAHQLCLLIFHKVLPAMQEKKQSERRSNLRKHRLLHKVTSRSVVGRASSAYGSHAGKI